MKKMLHTSLALMWLNTIITSTAYTMENPMDWLSCDSKTEYEIATSSKLKAYIEREQWSEWSIKEYVQGVRKGKLRFYTTDLAKFAGEALPRIALKDRKIKIAPLLNSQEIYSIGKFGGLTLRDARFIAWEALKKVHPDAGPDFLSLLTDYGVKDLVADLQIEKYIFLCEQLRYAIKNKDRSDRISAEHFFAGFHRNQQQQIKKEAFNESTSDYQLVRDWLNENKSKYNL